jgi:site-specific DNA recombinase
MNKETDTIKYFAYCRKSTDSEDRQIASIPDQKRELREYASREGIKILKIFEESRSAHTRGREIFKEMMDDIEKGVASGLLVWHSNRIARNASDGGLVVTLMDENKLKEIRTPQRTYRNHSDDKFMLQLEFGMAKKDSDDKGTAVKRSIKRKLLEGWRPGPAPIGYINVGETGIKSIIPDPERFKIIRKMWDLFLTGNYSVSQIRDISTKKWGLRTRTTKKMGGKPLSMSHLYKIFNESFYYGWYQWKNPETGKRELYKGEHKPIITEAEYNRAQLLLGKKGKPQPKTRLFAFTGIMTCGECGSGITAEEKNQIICPECRYKFAYENKTNCPKCNIEIAAMKKPVRLNYVYYHCTKKKNRNCSQGSIRIEELEKQFNAKLDTLKIDKDYLKLALDYLQKKQEFEANDEKTIRYSLQKTYDGCQTRLYNINREYTSPQNEGYALYTPEDFKRQKDELLRERGGIEEEMKTVKEKIDQTFELSERTFNYCFYAIHHFTYGDLQKKKEVFSTVGSNLTLKDGKLNVQALEPYLLIEKEVSSIRKRYERLEPEKSGFNKRKEAAFAASSPKWLGR